MKIEIFDVNDGSINNIKDVEKRDKETLDLFIPQLYLDIITMTDIQ